MRAHVYLTSDGWRWTVWARNGRIIGASCESYKRRAACVRNLTKLTGRVWPLKTCL